uniref:Uncharacterized protein n=1 Tax=Oryza meridionalis TaxID=40149 RepID=A0A0E0FBS2_9ORYZ
MYPSAHRCLVTLDSWPADMAAGGRRKCRIRCMGFSDLVQGGGGAACEEEDTGNDQEKRRKIIAAATPLAFGFNLVAWSSLVLVGVLKKRRNCGHWRGSDHTGVTRINPGLGAGDADRARPLPVSLQPRRQCDFPFFRISRETDEGCTGDEGDREQGGHTSTEDKKI